MDCTPVVGQGRHSLELTRRGFQNIKGLDRSHYLIQKARIKAKEEELIVKFKEGDAMILQAAEQRLKLLEETVSQKKVLSHWVA